MTDSQLKLLSATLLFIAWIGLIIAKHFWQDLDTGSIITAITSSLVGLGIYHINGNKGATP